MISVLAWMASWEIHRRGPGIALALHSSAAHVGQLHASLAASRAPQAVLVAGLLLTCAGYSFLPRGNKREKRKGKVLIVVGKQSLSRHRIHLFALRV